MAAKRTYGERCGVARALDVVGERWALLVVRELLLGPKRFGDLQAGLPRVGPDVLSQRLRDLTAAGVLRRRMLPPPAGVQVYELTERGAQLEPVVVALGRWGADTPPPPPEVGASLDAVLVSLKTLFAPHRAGRFAATLALRIDGQDFGATVADGVLDVARGAPPSPDATVETDARTLLELIRGRRELGAAPATVAGRRRTVARFLTLFPLPSEVD